MIIVITININKDKIVLVFIKFFYFLSFWHIKQVDVPSDVILEYLLDATPDFRLKRECATAPRVRVGCGKLIEPFRRE